METMTIKIPKVETVDVPDITELEMQEMFKGKEIKSYLINPVTNRIIQADVKSFDKMVFATNRVRGRK